MSNTTILKLVFREVQSRIDSGEFLWVSKDSEVEDYFDWGLSYKTTADSLIANMIEEGDLEAAE